MRATAEDSPDDPSTRRGRIAEIEYLRGVAILMVLVEHLPFNLLFWNSPTFRLLFDYGRGWMGVDLFFVVSGFVITRSLLPGAAILPRRAWVPFCVDFYRRRAWRLLPSAWLWLALIMIGSAVYNRSGAFQSVHANAVSCIAALLNVQNFHIAAILGQAQTGLAFPYWSLSLEEQFYVVLPIALLVLHGGVAIPLAAMLLTALLPPLPLFDLTRTSGFACGVSLGWAFHHWPAAMRRLRPEGLARHRIARIALPSLTLTLLVALGSEAALHVVRFRQLPITLLCAMLVWIAAYDSGLLCRAGPFRQTIEWVGSRSYSLYLVHIPVFAFIHETFLRMAPNLLVHPRPLWLYVLVALAVCAFVADLNYRLIELPLRRRGHLHRPPETPRQSASTPPPGQIMSTTLAEG